MTVKRKSTSSVPSWPPALHDGETDDEKRSRLQNEAEAKRISEMIDRQIERDRQQKKSQGVKILLLGQAESGKSTVLKNFQLYFAPKAFEIEAQVWRPVIHLNLVRSINFIITFVTAPKTRESSRTREASQHRRPSNSSSISPELRKLCVRLAPLRQVEEDLITLLSGRPSPRRSRSRRFDDVSDDWSISKAKVPQEIAFPSGGGWKTAFTINLSRRSGESSSGSSTRSADLSKDGQTRRILAALADDINALWTDPVVQSTLQKAEIALEEQPGFFLDHIARITREEYIPRPEDVLKARVTTIGPEEHKIISETGPESSKIWTIYDVGGSRSQRAAWAQFFDDVNMIIFLAPMSGFNQVLAEDESVNRLTDSLRLWQAICSNRILADVEFVLFLNKLDILDSKLKSGVQFSSFVTSYTDQPNETKPVAKYLLDVFVSLHQQYSPKKRKLHPHITCAVDTKATASIIYRIREVILVNALTHTNIL